MYTYTPLFKPTNEKEAVSRPVTIFFIHKTQPPIVYVSGLPC